MKKKYLALLIPVSILMLSFGKNKNPWGGPRLPVYGSYKYNNSIIPDSIKNSINLNFKSKKIKVLSSQDELTALVAAEINSTVSNLINSGGLNDRSAKNIADKVDAVGNILAVQIFNSQQSENSFTIDSIYWRTKTVPAKDTIWMYKKMFIPDSVTKLNVHTTLKLFVDKVLSSGYLL